MVGVRQGLGQFWDHITEGWHYLRERAGHALTHFHPYKTDSGVESTDDQLMLSGSRWGVLAAELAETSDRISVRLEVPGMNKEDFDIDVEDRELIIRGEKRVEHSEKKGHYHIKQCAYGHFERVIPLPAPVDTQKANASYLNGVLVLSLPKLTTHKTKKIEVTAQ
jgi:HSP20 family protein